MTPIEFKSARRALNLSVRHLASLCNMGVHGERNIRRWEAGTHPVPGHTSLLVTWLAYDVEPVPEDFDALGPYGVLVKWLAWDVEPSSSSGQGSS